ncbi:MAG: cytochrome c oxidase subunit, partial [Acidimicrobiia bacterium]|nr:cytochrome c oxidase subunit [Acidimicrobiia bacterium]
MADIALHTPAGENTATGLSNTKLAIWLFLGSECLLFGGLISTFMLYRGRVIGAGIEPSKGWPTAG